MLSDLCKEQHCHCLCLQETHIGTRKARPRIPGRTLVVERPHDKYGSAIFIRDYLKVKRISVTAANHVEVIIAELPDVVVHSVYKPPSEQFVLPPLGHRSRPQIVIGDFNSHNTIWGYYATDNTSVTVVQWAESNRIHPRCETTFFNSERWKKGYNTDLIFAYSSIDNLCVKSVLTPIPRTQHHPICVTVNPVRVPRPTAFRRRFNLRKANWSEYTTDVHILIDEVDPAPENYERFVEAIRVTSRKHIPRGRGSDYIHGLSEESKSLYDA